MLLEWVKAFFDNKKFQTVFSRKINKYLWVVEALWIFYENFNIFVIKVHLLKAFMNKSIF